MSTKKSKTRKALPSTNIRALKTAKILSEKGGTIGSAMLEAGYSREYSENPQKLTTTKTFQQIIAEAMPDDLLAKKHKSLLMAEVKTYVKGSLKTVRQDTEAIKAGLDMAYKLKGSYAPEKSIVLNLYQGKTDDELRAEIAQLERELRVSKNDTIINESEFSSDISEAPESL